MPTAAQRHRSTWLRRTRAITGWIAALAATATLLIAAVVGGASTTKKVIARTAQPARTVRVVHRTRAHPAHRHHVAKPKVTPNATPVAAAPPAAAPAAAPVVVSGGS